MLRTTRTGSWDAPPIGQRSRGLDSITADIGPVWARFDRDTGVLDTLIPHGLEVPDASNSGGQAERFARTLLERHVDLLAPGIDPADLVLVGDHESRGVRALGFAQTFRGVPVIGGQISFRFANDRLTLVRSQLIPNPDQQGLPVRTTTVEREVALERAREWIADDFAQGRIDQTSTGPLAGVQILPLVHASGAIELVEVIAIEVSLTDPIGRWEVFVDAATGEPVARRSTLMWANLQFEVPQRSPIGPRGPFAARSLEVDIAGTAEVTDGEGDFSVLHPNSAAEFGVSGPLVEVGNASGPVASLASVVGPSSTVVWGDESNEQLDAQLTTFIHARIVKDRVRMIAPDFDYLDQQLSITTNIEDVCNAFSDGDSLNFFLSGGGCENSGRIADIVYHEFGHSVHTQSLIPGVGLFEGALSEGVSDYLSATIVDSGQVGIGFFFDQSPIRDLDPDGNEWHWPEDKGEVHDEGRIIGGTLWDLRKAMRADQGNVGIAKTDHIWFEAIRRAVDIPSMYLEALAANDDDGNLANGTPDGCTINDAFAAHGLFEPPFGITELSVTEQPDFALALALEVGEAFPDCPTTVHPSVRWRVRAAKNAPENPIHTLAMQVDGQGLWHAKIPAQPEFTVLQYQVAVDWGNGTIGMRPDNPADPWYEHFVGEATEIWCSHFENQTEGWNSTGFQLGMPAGGSGDPDAAYAGSKVAGTGLAQPGTYAPGATATLTSPAIQVGEWDHVRLQYRRWLNVEDGFFDQATIFANDVAVWRNFASPNEWTTNDHRDREWRFHDVELTDQVAANGTVRARFGLHSDGGLEFGGWNVDEVCIVGHGGAAAMTCGNAMLEPSEQCDDGNTAGGDGCNAGCMLEDDPAQQEMSGTADTGDDDYWVPEDRGCGCASEPESPRGAGVLGLALLGLLGFVRRRTRRA